MYVKLTFSLIFQIFCLDPDLFVAQSKAVLHIFNNSIQTVEIIMAEKAHELAELDLLSDIF